MNKMKKLLIILFAFAFLGAFAKTHNHENNPDVSDDTAAYLMQYAQTHCGARAHQSDRYNLRNEDREGYRYSYTSCGHSDRYSTGCLIEGYYHRTQVQARYIRTDRESRCDYGYVSVRFAASLGKAIRNDHQELTDRTRPEANTRYHQRAHGLATHILQGRFSRYADTRRGRHLETHLKKA